MKYLVTRGWNDGSEKDEWTFGSEAEARELYASLDLRQQYRTEKMTAGRLWRERTAEKEIVPFVDEDGWPEYGDPIEHDEYGRPDYAAEEGL